MFLFTQNASIRLTSQGDLFRDDDGQVDAADVTFSEPIAIIGTASDYGVTYDANDDDDLTTGTQRSVTPESVANSGGNDTVEMTIPNQSYQDDPGGTFDVEVTGTANVKDEAGNPVDTDNASAWTTTVSDFNNGGPEIDSAETTSTTTIEVEFNEDLDDATVVAANFDSPSDVSDATETSAGSVELTLDSAIGTGDTPNIGTTSSLEDVAGNTARLKGGEFELKAGKGCSCSYDDECLSGLCISGKCISVTAPQVYFE